MVNDATKEKTHIVHDAEHDTILYVRSTTDPRTAIMTPVGRSSILQRLFMKKFYVALIGTIIACSIIAPAVVTTLNTMENSLVSFFIIGSLLLFCVPTIIYFANHFFKDTLESMIVKEMRLLKGNGLYQEFFVNASLMYVGTDGDFVTLYHQEKNKRRIVV